MITMQQYISADKNKVFYTLLEELGWQGFSMNNVGKDRNIYNDISRLEYLYLSGILDQEIEQRGELSGERLRKLMRQVPLEELQKEFNAEQVCDGNDQSEEESSETAEEKMTRMSQRKNLKDNLMSDVEPEKSESQAAKEESICIEYKQLLKQIIDRIKKLEEKELHKLFAYYLLTVNLLAHWIDTKPADMPVQIKQAFDDVDPGVKLVVTDKRARIENAAFSTGIWDEIATHFKNGINCNDFKTAKEKFEQYSKSLGANPARTWKTAVAKLLADLSTEKNQQIVKLIEEDLLLCVRMRHANLSVLKKRYLKNFSVHEINTQAALVTCCPEYAPVIAFLALQEAADKDYRKNIRSEKIKAELVYHYKNHYRKCAACRDYHKELVENFKYRLGLFAQKWDLVAKKLFSLHKPGKNNSPTEDVKTIIKYYEAVFDKRPSDLYKAYLEVLHKWDGTNFKLSAKSRKKQQERGSKLGYTLETRCLCGAVNWYKLNALRFPVVTIGRKQEDGVMLAHINLCADSEGKLARQLCYFKYDCKKRDWVFGAGSGDTKNPTDPDELKEIASRILYITPQSLFSRLDRVKTAGADRVSCQKALQHGWTQLEANKQVPLSEIALICVMKKNEKIYHPIFGLLEHRAWLIEINANRSDVSIIGSAVARSVLSE